MFLVTLFSAQVVVVSLGWCELADEDLTPENSSKAVNRCGGNRDSDNGDGGDGNGDDGAGDDMMMVLAVLKMKMLMKNSSKAVNRCQKMRKARRCFPNQPLSKETDFIYRFCDRLP